MSEPVRGYEELPPDMRRLVDLHEVGVGEAHKLLERRAEVEVAAALVRGFLRGIRTAQRLRTSPIREEIIAELDELERTVLRDVETELWPNTQPEGAP